MNQFVLASHNKGKIKEFQHIFEKNARIIPQSEFQITSIEETGTTFIENALIKARHASRYSGLPALADDSGLVVPALNGEPGIYSARYAGDTATDEQNIQALTQKLRPLSFSDRQAFFYCVLVYIKHPNDPCPMMATGSWWGELLTEPQGDFGFGYDPIFFLSTYQATAAQLPISVKNKISHRALALRHLYHQFQHHHKPNSC